LAEGPSNLVPEWYDLGALAFTEEISGVEKIERKSAEGMANAQINVSRHGGCESPP
jgi:hypothetical protein